MKWSNIKVKVNGYNVYNIIRPGGGSSGYGGFYDLYFKASEVNVDILKGIDWAHPNLTDLAEMEEMNFPTTYGFEMSGIKYLYGSDEYVVTIRASKQYLGDVTAYQDEIISKQKQLSEYVDTIRAKDAEINELNDQLAEADELVIALYEASRIVDEDPGVAETGPKENEEPDSAED